MEEVVKLFSTAFEQICGLQEVDKLVLRQLCGCTIVSAKSSAIVSTIEPSEKTTLIKRLSDWAAAQGYKVLIFDTKETEADYADFGQARALR